MIKYFKKHRLLRKLEKLSKEEMSDIIFSMRHAINTYSKYPEDNVNNENFKFIQKLGRKHRSTVKAIKKIKNL